MKRTIIIMAKVPAAGAVKTRLHSILAPEKCAALAEAFLHDALRKARKVSDDIILAYSPAGRGKRLKAMLAAPVELLAQTGGDLGARMANAFAFAFAEKPDSAVVMIGTDSPTLPAGHLRAAFDALESGSEIVLGKSVDGGFYLIGLRGPQSSIFEGVGWSTPEVFDQLTGNIRRAGIEGLRLLPEHFDVDTPDDFKRMRDEILADETLQKTAENTFRWLAANGETI